MAPAVEAASLTGGETAARIERILCPVDFSEISAKAYRYAQSIACRYRAQLILQHVVELWQHQAYYYQVGSEYAKDFRQTLISNAQDQLRQFVDLYGGIDPECVVEESVTADAILSLARARAVSLIAMGTHGRRGFDHFMLGSVTERILRRAPCPVLAIPPKAPDASMNVGDDVVRVQRILCCVDFSANSQRALDHALSVAGAYGAELTILHVLDNISEPIDVAKETDAVMAKLQQLVTPSAIAPTRVHLEVCLGKPYREILDFATAKQSDLIVVGVRGRNSLDLTVFGSTTYRLIQLNTGPVLIVPI